MHACLAAGLISDLTLSRVPILTGSGHNPFAAVPSDILLEHQRTKVYPGGVVQTSYRVVTLS